MARFLLRSWIMDRTHLANELAAAERELRSAQAAHNGSDEARRRYREARARLVQAELRALLFAVGGATPRA